MLDLIRSENDRLIEGVPVPPPSIIDDHVLHLKEHAAVANSPEFREDEARMSNLVEHMMGHIQLLMDPSGQVMQTALGYQSAAPAQTGTPSAPPPKKQPESANGSIQESQEPEFAGVM